MTGRWRIRCCLRGQVRWIDFEPQRASVDEAMEMVCELRAHSGLPLELWWVTTT